MARLSTTAWILHDVGLATAIGGTLFGRNALQPALREIDSGPERDRVADTAWRRFSWINLAAHGVMAATWIVGRSMLSGREVNSTSRALTIAKDGLVVASLVTGLSSVILGRVLGSRTRDEARRMDARTEASIRTLRKAVGVVGVANLVANTGIAAVTTALSMEASKSLPFSFVSRRLP